jgi:hypothetical protein
MMFNLTQAAIVEVNRANKPVGMDRGLKTKIAVVLLRNDGIGEGVLLW